MNSAVSPAVVEGYFIYIRKVEELALEEEEYDADQDNPGDRQRRPRRRRRSRRS